MKKYAAEFIATFILVFCGTGAVIIDQQTGGGVTHAGIAITFGLVVMSMIFTFGGISGAHMNPAVTISFWLAKQFQGKEIAPYICSQVLGAIAASVLLRLLFPANQLLGGTQPAGSEMQSFVLEIFLTFILMLVVIQMATHAKEKGPAAALAISSIVLLEAMFAGPISGASMNPARSLAPALVSGHLEHLWIYLTAPTIGAALSIPAWWLLHKISATTL